MTESSTIVPIGKYKGQPVEVLASDPGYTDWLTAQDWFRERYGNIYTLIVNNFKEPTETPEHNAMQVRFLDDDFLKRFYLSLVSGKLKKVPGDLAGIVFDNKNPFSVEIEHKGFDVCFRANHRVETVIFKNEELEEFDEWNTRLKESSIASEKAEKIDDETILIYDYPSWFMESSMPRTIWVELKPSLGDDYPSVLRQINANRENLCYVRHKTYYGDKKFYEPKKIYRDIFVLLIGQYAGSGATFEQVRTLFRKSRIHTICL